MSKKDKGAPVFSDVEVATLAKSMIFPEEGVGLYLDILNQKVKEQATRVSEVLKEAKLAPMDEQPEDTNENRFFAPVVETPLAETSNEELSVQPTKSREEELTDRNLEGISMTLLNNEEYFNNFIANYDFLKNEGIDLTFKKLEKTFAPLAIINNASLRQAYGVIIANGYGIVKPNGNLTLQALLIDPSSLEIKFDILRNADAGDFYKLYPELIVCDANEIASRINYCQNNNIEFKTNINGKDIYLPVILSKEEFERVGGAA